MAGAEVLLQQVRYHYIALTTLFVYHVCDEVLHVILYDNMPH